MSFPCGYSFGGPPVGKVECRDPNDEQRMILSPPISPSFSSFVIQRFIPVHRAVNAPVVPLPVKQRVPRGLLPLLQSGLEHIQDAGVLGIL